VSKLQVDLCVGAYDCCDDDGRRRARLSLPLPLSRFLTRHHLVVSSFKAAPSLITQYISGGDPRSIISKGSSINSTILDQKTIGIITTSHYHYQKHKTYLHHVRLAHVHMHLMRRRLQRPGHAEVSFRQRLAPIQHEGELQLIAPYLPVVLGN
jgi:hypothetical protein